MIDDNCYKKQMEFRGGKLHSIITDQDVNTNRIFANRYSGKGVIGFWYFAIDCTYHFENFLLVMLIICILYVQSVSLTASYQQSVQLYFPISSLVVNFLLMAVRNIIFEHRQNRITNKINNKYIEYLFVARTSAYYMPIAWEKVKPGYVIKIKRGEEFPADCLILDIQGAEGQKCYVTCGPFDIMMTIVQKKSF